MPCSAGAQRSIHLMKNHDFFVTQIVFPVTVNLISWPIVAVLACTGRLTAEERATPRWKFAALALMAGTFNLANAFPQSVLPGSLMTVLFTTHTPILMLMSRVLLGTRYRWPHFVSAALIIGAAAIITLPKLRTAAVSGTDLLWIVVYVALLFNPNDIYTEKWLKDVNMSTWYFRANVGVFELLLGLLLVPTMLVHIPGHTHVPADQLWSHLQESWRCFWGSPIAAGPGNMTLALGAGPTQPCADSLEVWQVWGVFIALYPFSIITTLMLTKYGSAVLSSVVSALSVPVTVAFYQWPALAGVVAQHGLGWNTAVAMVVAAIGVALYTTANERSKQRQLSLMDEVARSLSRGPPGEAARYRALHDGAGGDDAGDDRLSVEVGPSGTR